jgi:hypothetical protein
LTTADEDWPMARRQVATGQLWFVWFLGEPPESKILPDLPPEPLPALPTLWWRRRAKAARSTFH